MHDYRGIIQNIIDTVEEISVRGSTDGQRIYTIVYALKAMQNEMTLEMEANTLRKVIPTEQGGDQNKMKRDCPDK